MNSLLNFELGEKRTSEEIKTDLYKILDYSVHTHSLTFFNQLFVGSDVYTVLSELILALINTSMYTFEMAPIFTYMEGYLLIKLICLFGFINGDLIFCPGGSISNMNAIHLARFHFNKSINKNGNMDKLKIFCSDHAHYSFKKGCSFMGLGYDAIISIKTNKYGEMDTNELEKSIKSSLSNKELPFMVVATAGTTVFGAIDPIDKIHIICKKYKLWLHVDGSWGASLILSKKHKHKLKGINYADSITWNPHKMIQVPLQCSILLTKHNKILKECNSYSASYLFQTDKFYDSVYDTGDKYIQCGRKVDVLKLWVRWKVDGDDGLENRINKICDLAQKFKLKIMENDNFELVQDKINCTNVCFWFIPNKLKGKKVRNMNVDEQKIIHRLAPIIKKEMMESGDLMISYQPFKNLPNFFRIVFINPEFNDLDFIINWFKKIK